MAISDDGWVSNTSGAGPVEHRPPTEGTIKQLYGTAWRCGEPTCKKPLYRLNDETGEYILNSRVAHIHARSQGGPRWDPDMSEADNRDASNLIPLCETHAWEIDQTPQHFTADLLREWKKEQLAEFQKLQRSWKLTDAEAADVVNASFSARDHGLASAAASTMLAVARYCGAIIESGQQQRSLVKIAVDDWLLMRRRVSRAMPIYDANGERLTVEPSRAETQPYAEALGNALAAAVVTLSAPFVQLIGELHAAKAADQALTPWCDWVERCARRLLDAAGRWPGRPPESADDQLWTESVNELKRASLSLTATWKGATAELPPVEPPPQPEPEETDSERLVREHHELLEAARPWARVTHRPYDRDLCDRLMAETAVAVNLPPIMSLIPVGLDTTASLAAKVARNAKDQDFREVIARSLRLEPLAAAVAVLRELMFVARKAERTQLEAESLAAVMTLLIAEPWSLAATWNANIMHARRLLSWTAEQVGDEAIQSVIIALLKDQPQMLEPVLIGVSTWSESVGGEARPRIANDIEDLPSWFPVGNVAELIVELLPDVQPLDDYQSYRYGSDVERLSARVLWIAQRGQPGSTSHEDN